MSPRFIFYLILLVFISIYGVYSFNKLTRPYKVLVILILLTLISEFCGRWTYAKYKLTFPPYHFLIPITIFFHAVIYNGLTELKTRYKNLIFVASGFFILLSIINTVYFQSIFSFPSNSITLLSINAIFLSLITFLQMLKFPTEVQLTKQSMFWFNLGNFIFYTLTFFAFAFINYRTNYNAWIAITIWSANIILYVCYFISIFYNKTKING